MVGGAEGVEDEERKEGWGGEGRQSVMCIEP